MTKRQDLCLQRRSRPEQSDQRQPNQAANIFHQPRASPDSTSLASRIAFPTMTGLRVIAFRAVRKRGPTGISLGALGASAKNSSKDFLVERLYRVGHLSSSGCSRQNSR